MTATDKSNPNKDNAGVLIPPPLIYLAFVGIVAGLQAWALPLPIDVDLTVIAWACVVIGLALILWCSGLFRKAGTSLPPVSSTKAIVSTGPYRFSRNPIYLGMAVIYLGLGFFLQSLWTPILLPVLILTVTRYVIAREEAYLERKFGEEYLTFKAATRRWI